MAPAAGDPRREKEDVEAETALVQAQLALVKARAQLQVEKTASDPVIVAATSEKARLDAAKELSDARQGSSAASAAAAVASTQARLGAVTPRANAPTGAVEVGTNAGKGESTLLAARATRLAAERIAIEIGAALVGRTVSVVSGLDGLQLVNGSLFALHERVVVATCADAVEAAGHAMANGRGTATEARRPADPGPTPEVLGRGGSSTEPASMEALAMPTLTTVGVALDALDKLAGYFRSDYALSSLEVTGDNAQLVAAVAGALLRLDGAGRPAKLLLPSMIVPDAGDAEELLKGLLEATSQARNAQLNLQAAALDARSSAASEQDEVEKSRRSSAAQAYEAGLPPLDRALARADEFIGSLFAADPAGVPNLFKVLRDRAIKAAITSADDAAVLYVEVRGTAGGAYAKKNLWTFLGGMPFYVMGGIVVAYSAVEAKSGVVLASGVVPIHGGYQKVGEVLRAISSLYAGPPFWAR